ncbi:hypothetical protein HKX48_006635 [Thoreauomyces humboldtii]|nr:hypothetical protein HKX48_006635 [Thoreauomyces humboldtii]
MKRAVRRLDDWTRRICTEDDRKQCVQVAKLAAPGVVAYRLNSVMAELHTEALLRLEDVCALSHDTTEIGKSPVDRDASEDQPKVVQMPLAPPDGSSPYFVRHSENDDEEIQMPARVCTHCSVQLPIEGQVARCETCRRILAEDYHAGSSEFCEKCFATASDHHPADHTIQAFHLPGNAILSAVESRLECSLNATWRTHQARSVRSVDEALPIATKHAIATHLDAIARLPHKDIRPWAYGKVHDVIHPSIYPYVRGESFVRRDNERCPPADGNGQESGRYQWLPAEVDVDDAGAATFKSRISDRIDAKDEAELANALEGALTPCIPLWEACTTRMLRGQRIQVVVKAINYTLKPGETHEGHWQLAGMPQDHILASSIYCYASSPLIRDHGLAFRGLRRRGSRGCHVDAHLADLVRDAAAACGVDMVAEWDARIEDDVVQKVRAAHAHCAARTFDLGCIATREGRLIAYPNAAALQHRIAGYKHILRRGDERGDEASTHSGLAQHKVLVFLLVNPGARVQSTGTVPTQRWDRMRPYISVILDRAASMHLRRPLPMEILTKLVDRAKWGMSMQEARVHRLCITREGKEYVDSLNAIWETGYDEDD